MRILHILPDSAVDPKQRFLGSTKDLRGRTEYFKVRGFDSEEIVVPRRRDSVLKRLLARKDLSELQAVFIELPLYPGAIRYLRHNYPGLRIFVRPINAEFYHHWHYVISGIKHGYWKRSFFYAFFSWRRLYQDFSCSHGADHVFSITEWEVQHYWRFMAGKGKAISVPYFVPSEYCLDILDQPKNNICVCLLSTIMNSFLADAAENFNQAIFGLGKDLPNWEFYVTGANPPMPNVPLPRLKATGLLDSPFDILARSRAMAILSDFGFGFKTKILDAILHKCFVLVTSGLYDRLPEVIRPFCFVVDPADPDTFRRALESCLNPFPNVDANVLLRAQAFAALDKAFDGVD